MKTFITDAFIVVFAFTTVFASQAFAQTDMGPTNTLGACHPNPPAETPAPPAARTIIKEVVREVPGPERIVIKEVPVSVPLPTWDVMFDFGQSTPRAKCKEKLDQIAQYMKDNPNRTVILAGHADIRTLKGQPLNTKLADQRAKSVVKALADRGVDVKRIRVTSFGSQLPVWEAPGLPLFCPAKQPGKTSIEEEAKCEKDRRVEVLVK